jgi:ABC-type transport system substrate-binding protein
MKKLIIVLAALLAFFVLAGPALAASLGMSPSSVTVEVPAEGNATVAMTAYYYTGDVEVSLEGIPLTVTPANVHVDALDNPQPFALTIHGDPSLGSKIYDGYIRFQGSTDGMIAVAVKVKAHVTNLVAGQEPVLASPAPAKLPPSEPGAAAESEAGQASGEQGTTASGSAGGIGGLSTNMVIIIAGGLVFVGLVVLAISLAVRRRY